MIVVTGSCRTGTSYTMQMLQSIGYPIVGLKYHDDFPDVDLNPYGYWDLPLIKTVHGIHNNQYKGKGIKLFGYQLSVTNPIFVSKIIICKRNKEDAVLSTVKLLERRGYLFNMLPTKENAISVYDANYFFINDYVLQHNIPYINIEYEDSVKDRTKTEQLLSKFINNEI
jgi:hypothetical protein